MPKDPAFLFYPNDFDAKTKFMSNAQVGIYLRCLIAQHQIGHLTEKQMLFICGKYDEDIFIKFTKDAQGLFYNERLENEIERRKAYSVSRSKNKTKKTDKAQLEITPSENNKPGISIGLNSFAGSTSEWLMQNKEAAIESLMMKFSGLKTADVYSVIDIETVNYHFKDHNHPYNYFKSTAEKLFKKIPVKKIESKNDYSKWSLK